MQAVDTFCFMMWHPPEWGGVEECKEEYSEPLTRHSGQEDTWAYYPTLSASLAPRDSESAKRRWCLGGHTLECIIQETWPAFHTKTWGYVLWLTVTLKLGTE